MDFKKQPSAFTVNERACSHRRPRAACDRHVPSLCARSRACASCPMSSKTAPRHYNIRRGQAAVAGHRQAFFVIVRPLVTNCFFVFRGKKREAPWASWRLVSRAQCWAVAVERLSELWRSAFKRSFAARRRSCAKSLRRVEAALLPAVTGALPELTCGPAAI